MRVEQIVTRVGGRRATVAVAAVLLLVLAGSVVALIGDDGVPKSVASSTAALARDEAAIGVAAPNAATDGGGMAGAMAVAPKPAAPPNLAVADKAGAKIVKTASLRVEVAKGGFRSAFDRAAAVANRFEGYVASSSEATVDDKASEGTLTIRVPADRFDAARQALAGLGKVDHQELGGQDVTAQIVDYDARIRSLQAQEQALATLLGRARSVAEVLEVQSQLFNVRQQIEQLQAERGNLDAQASMATITATVFEPGAAATTPKPEPASGLARSWARAWDAAIAVVGGMVIVVGVLLPLAAVALMGWALWRLAASRRRPAATTPAA